MTLVAEPTFSSVSAFLTLKWIQFHLKIKVNPYLQLCEIPHHNKDQNLKVLNPSAIQ